MHKFHLKIQAKPFRYESFHILHHYALFSFCPTCLALFLLLSSTCVHRVSNFLLCPFTCFSIQKFTSSVFNIHCSASPNLYYSIFFEVSDCNTVLLYQLQRCIHFLHFLIHFVGSSLSRPVSVSHVASR